MSQLRHLPIIACPTSTRPPFTFSAATRVGFSDTDAQGIVYYGRYAPYFDIARVEYWRNLGLAAHDDPDKGEFVMRAFNIEYHAPAMFDDLLEIFIRSSKLGNSSLTFEFAVTKGDGSGMLLATATQTMVNVDFAGDERKACPISDRIRGLISGFEPGLPSS